MRSPKNPLSATPTMLKGTSFKITDFPTTEASS